MTSLRRGLSLLDALAEAAGPLTLGELSARATLPKSTAHRLLRDLIAVRLVHQASDGRYSLGLRLAELGQQTILRLPIRAAARSVLRELRAASGVTAHLGICLGGSVLYVDKVAGPPPVRTRIGGRSPLTSTALGKALLAYAPAELRREVLSRPVQVRTARTIVDPRRLRFDLAHVAERGWALDDRECDPDLRCIAAPVRDADGAAVAAVSVSAPAEAMGTRSVRRLADLVTAAADAIADRGLRTAVDQGPLGGMRSAEIWASVAAAMS